MDIEFWETFTRKFPKLKQLAVLKLTQVQKAVLKTETNSSFELSSRLELNSGIMNQN
jgi:hypothetical protein